MAEPALGQHALLQGGAREARLRHGASESPITPVIVGDGALAGRFSDRLFELGMFAQAVVFPTVPAGRSRVRTIVTATHTQDELVFALDCFKRAGTELGILQ